jgi:putative redox protein
MMLADLHDAHFVDLVCRWLSDILDAWTDFARSAEVPSEPFDFRSPDGHLLSGALDLPDGEARTHAVFAHCFTCTKSSLAAARIARALIVRGIAVLRFDFTGLGQSGGDFADSTFSGSIRDLAAAVVALASVGRAPRLLIGHSLGGAAVLAAAAELPEIKAVATIGAPFDVAHVTNLLRDGMPALLSQGEAEVEIGGRPFRIRRSFINDLARHDQGQRIAALKRPILVLHSPVDTVVGIENASAIFSAAKHPKSFVSLDHADHLLSRPADAQYAAEVIAAWASRYVALRAGSDQRA